MAPSFIPFLFVAAALAPRLAAARDVPDNLKKLYSDIVQQGQCDDKLASGFHSTDGDDGDFSYCGDYLDRYGIIYVQGNDGQLTNMDVDCDGVQGSKADDGRCGASSDTQSITTFQYDVSTYADGVKDLDAYVHPYVVFGNSGTKKDWPEFDPLDHGIEPLSIMAVVCNDQLFYGIWGDTNGDDGEQAMVGEASISLATACFGKENINGNAGHDENDVLFLAFVGKDAVPGDSADWNTTSATKFADSIRGMGDKLVERVGVDGHYRNDDDDNDDDSASVRRGVERTLLGMGLAAALVAAMF